ncbi:MAG TPA: hypothetical protein VGM92_14500 [Candidatus Kapabacteria bacterium]
MKKSLLLLPLILASCIAKPIISDTACNDPEYLRLRSKPIDSMTDREFAYYQMKDRECEQAHSNANAVMQLEHSMVADQIISKTSCGDSLYLLLKQKPIKEMSAREFEYYKMKDNECEETRASANAVTQLQTGGKETSILLIVIEAVLLGALIVFAPWNRN